MQNKQLNRVLALCSEARESCCSKNSPETDTRVYIWNLGIHRQQREKDVTYRACLERRFVKVIEGERSNVQQTEQKLSVVELKPSWQYI